MDDAVAMDEFQEADILWPDSEDQLVVPFAPVGADLPYEAAGSVSSGAAPVLGRRFEGLFFGPSLSASAGACDEEDDDEEEWQEADVLWPDTAVELRGRLGGSLWPFPGCSASAAGRHLMKPAAARRDGWRTGPPAASTPIDIPGNVSARRRF
ncbi:hypothetical protein U9M48_017721 [Paspalum notatum var. saurae]|uniref:Uncharacterized protein n=1 Tax=Paspalum notatum var. saurae TaxID=547442 RepID=A0AAQ3WP35_PASNO